MDALKMLIVVTGTEICMPMVTCKQGYGSVS